VTTACSPPALPMQRHRRGAPASWRPEPRAPTRNPPSPPTCRPGNTCSAIRWSSQRGRTWIAPSSTC